MNRAVLVLVVALAATDAFAGGVAIAERVAVMRRRTLPDPPPPRRDRVRAALAKQRARHLAALRAYRKRDVFAHAYDREGEVYVWRDQDGHLDAIAALMAGDGKTQAAQVDAVAAQMVGVHLVDATYGPVHVWSVTSGFSPDELDRLQRPHVRPPVVRIDETAWKTDEDVRLARAYGAVESYLRAHTADGLDAATDALMTEPLTAWLVVEPKHKFPAQYRQIPEPDIE